MPNHNHPNMRDGETRALVTTSADTQHFVTTRTLNTHAHTTYGKQVSHTHTQHLL